MSKIFGVIFTLLSFFVSMAIAFGAEFLLNVNSVFFALIVLSLVFFLVGFALMKKRKKEPFLFSLEIILTEFILAVILFPLGFFEKFIDFRDRFHDGFLSGLAWIAYLLVPALALFLLAVVSGIFGTVRYFSEKKRVGNEENNF